MRVESVTVRYWAALKEAAGLSEEQVDAATLKDALEAVRRRHSDRFSKVLDQCSLIVDGQRVSHTAELRGVTEIDCLPPFAGG